MSNALQTTVILQLICPDRPGLVSELSTWISNNNGNIRHADHHTDEGAGLFLSRLEWDLNGFKLSRQAIQVAIVALANSLEGKAELHFSDELPRVAIFVSKQSHCLLDLLWRSNTQELKMNVPLVISNHNHLQKSCKQYNVDYKFIPVNKLDKSISEQVILDTLSEYNIDLIVLAKYMQILSSNFLDSFPNIINIHHSFLPAFKGAKPYHRAWDRGVKLIGATAHYVTKDLDDGPIIEQTIAHVTHRDEVNDLIRKGRDTERLALARALRLHLRRQVMVYEGRTAIFA
ncbi:MULTISPECIES: formyltetrahydrofolate deformylase [unclassified Prochlorococcus]|uniref:formyltetrahydrofolate deformylase n=1 Tax=unclassified Prochlorococcus TaxID=2627481 RepID=UPI000533A7F5|nr:MULTISPECIES: formyltetrahydrofolate deformylase [unclassified Prochlorococcus]KGG14513.1 Formyltetrahydrofolate deformylase [Prochlorococcus sp. MIT 0602]KGG16062.1 Formyltetrahydrofolate deformylase [Prochlorococcus sp. MIT 0603]